MGRGKRYVAAREQIDRDRQYPPAEAVELLKQTAGTKFDETVELHIRLGVNVRHAEEQLRGTLALPHGLGKDVTIAAFAQGDAAKAASDAGADFVGGDDLAERIEGGWTDFDVAVATPDMMPVVGKLGRILGPQGKMPNPKVGTVTDDIAKAVEESKSGKIEYRTDRQAVIHLAIGKASFDAASPARQLRRRDRRDRARQAGRRQGPLPDLDHARDDDGPGDPRRHARARARPRSCPARPPTGRAARATRTPAASRRPSPRRRPRAHPRRLLRQASRRPPAGPRPVRPVQVKRGPRSEPACVRALRLAATTRENDGQRAESSTGRGDDGVARATPRRSSRSTTAGSASPRPRSCGRGSPRPTRRFRIVKNRLAKLAAENAGTDGLVELFEGPTALTFVKGDPVTAAKAIATFGREHDVLDYKGGLMEGDVLDPDQFQAIARLPGLDVLRGQLVGVAASPITGLARGLGALLSGLAIGLGQIQEQGLVGGDDRAPEPEASGGSRARRRGGRRAEADAEPNPTRSAEAEEEAEPEAEEAPEPEADEAPEPEADSRD